MAEILPAIFFGHGNPMIFGVLSPINGSKNGSKFGRGEPLILTR